MPNYTETYNNACLKTDQWGTESFVWEKYPSQKETLQELIVDF